MTLDMSQVSLILIGPDWCCPPEFPLAVIPIEGTCHDDQRKDAVKQWCMSQGIDPDKVVWDVYKWSKYSGWVRDYSVPLEYPFDYPLRDFEHTRRNPIE